MDRASSARRIGRGLMVLMLAVSVGSVTSPGAAYARHGNGAAIALGILGGALAGAAMASPTAPGDTRAPLGYFYPYAPHVFSAAPAPAYYYAPSATYYGPTLYYGSQDYYGGN